MFTGIIKEVSEVAVVKKRGGNLAVAVAKPARWKVRAGESISVNGICSTVVKVGHGIMQFEYMPETLRKTTAASWRAGEKVNLEQSLRVGDTLDGHLVMGHVDGVGRITVSVRDSGERLLKIETESEILALIAKKGSVAVEGVSLTVVGVSRDAFTVALIPYTLSHTNLRERRVGDRVNVEVDILSKYAANLSC